MTQTLQIKSPASEPEFLQRDLLLASTLREVSLAWPYAAEYPIVLAKSSAQNSHCVFSGEKVAAHANLWKRKLAHASGTKELSLGLIGNVTTSPEFRGLGIQHHLMDHLEKTAVSLGLDALILWSDLLEFYQKLGFRSTGREWRFVISSRERITRTNVQETLAKNMTLGDLEGMLVLRPRLEWQLLRSLEEFATLLTIPDTTLFVNCKGDNPVSYYVLGKGTDMQGVIHEWGASKPALLLQDLQSILAQTGLKQVTLLAPAGLQGSYLRELTMHCSSQSEHAMALAKPIGSNGEAAMTALAQGFIWGLDSI